MVISQRREFNKDLTYDTNFWLLNIKTFQIVEIADNTPYIFTKFHHGRLFLRKGLDADLLPFFMESICTSGNGFIWSGGIEYTHENVTIYNGLHSFGHHWQSNGKSWVGLHTVCINRDNRNLRHTGFFQCTADKSDIVGSTAAAAGLAHKDSGAVQIIFAGQQCIHDLTDNDQRRIAGVIIYILKTYIHCVAVMVLQDLYVIAKSTDGRFDQVKMDW